MKLLPQTYSIPEKPYQDITSLDFTPGNFLLLDSSGNLELFNLQTQEIMPFLTFPFLTDWLNIKIYTYRNYICLVENKGIRGIVLNLEDIEFSLNLSRGDYQVEHCSFPIAFFSQNAETYLLHGTDWNRLDITRLRDQKLMTNRVVDYETSSNYFDYFHSSLTLSPDQKHFVSNGWIWQPFDVPTLYSIQSFFTQFEACHTFVDFGVTTGYNWDRPLCWVDNTTIAIGYNPQEDEEKAGLFPSEIILYDINKNEIKNRIPFPGFASNEYGEVSGQLHFIPSTHSLMGINGQTGLYICDLYGQEQLKSPELTNGQFFPGANLLYRLIPEQSLLEIVPLEK